MFFVLSLLIIVHHVSSECTRNNVCQNDYRLTRLEVSTVEKVSRLREDMEEALKDQKNSIQEISLECIKNKVPDNQNVATSEIEDLVKPLNDRLQNLENLLLEQQNIFKNSSFSEWHGFSYPKNCAEVHNKTSNGVYKVKPGQKEVNVFCDLTTDGGGWTVIQSRKSNSVEFYNGWNEYKKGFGSLQGDFWLGLETIYELTNVELNELLIELEDFDRVKRKAKYSLFGIGSEDEGYSLKILGTYSGDAGDSFSYHAGQKFSTKDKDQDMSTDNCAVNHSGAWWYKQCNYSNLNGAYLNGETKFPNRTKGMIWLEFRGFYYSLKLSRMLIRPVRYKK